MPHTNLTRFRFYLARHTSLTYRTVGSTASRIKRVETALGATIDQLFGQYRLASLRARITTTDPAFAGENAAAMRDCQTAVSRYREFQRWNA